MARQLISPRDYLGFSIGMDRCLANWEQIVGYCQLLSAVSPRIHCEELGVTTEGRPLIVLYITSPENQGRLEDLRAIQMRLVDQRRLTNEDNALLIEAGKTVVLVTCGIHATEVGSSQMSMQLIYELATRDDDEIKEVLDNTILLLVPSLNPDGLDLVVNWYTQTLSTPYEGTIPPFLYHKYAGHDNNRDWFMFALRETRLVVEKLHNRWHPQIVLDQHQQNQDGARVVLPPFVDPYDPNVDPIIRQSIAWLGQAIAAELTGQGKSGVMTNAIYDAWSPSRAYQHYHSGVRILVEVASARIASPVKLEQSGLQARLGSDPKVASWNHPEIWPGGTWRLLDIVECAKICTWACLMHAAKYRRQWLRNFALLGKRALLIRESCYAFVILREQRDVKLLAELLDILMFAGVEVHEACLGFTADGIDYPPGTYVVLLHQPFGSFAKTMLERQSYPDLHVYPGGPPKRPYDTTAHSLPIQMGVLAVEVKAPFVADLALLAEVPRFVRPRLKAGGNEWAFIRPEANHSFLAYTELVRAGHEVFRLCKEVDSSRLPPGTFLVRATDPLCSLLVDLGEQYGLCIGTIDKEDVPNMAKAQLPRIGVYQSRVPNPDEGWLRFVLEEYGFPYVTLGDKQVAKGDLSSLFDVVVLPSAEIKNLHEGHAPGSYPSEYTGGLGTQGASEIRRFVENGGTLLAIDAASEWAIRELCLPVKNVIAGIPESDFFVPGSFLRLMIDTHHPLGYGLPRELAVVSARSPAFGLDGQGRVVGKYPMANPLLSGWILGAEKLFGRAALVECGYGLGRAILVGFRPHFRAQARGTYKVLFNALLYSTLRH